MMAHRESLQRMGTPGASLHVQNSWQQCASCKPELNKATADAWHTSTPIENTLTLQRTSTIEYLRNEKPLLENQVSVPTVYVGGVLGLNSLSCWQSQNALLQAECKNLSNMVHKAWPILVSMNILSIQKSTVSFENDFCNGLLVAAHKDLIQWFMRFHYSLRRLYTIHTF